MTLNNDNGFVVKDSGERKEYASGMRRDTQEGKPNYRLIDIPFLRRLAWHLTKGAEKYGRDNWRLANSQEELDRFQDSGLRHHMQYLSGETDEDHAMATVFNIMAAEHCKLKIEEQQIAPKKNRTDDVRKLFGYGARRPKENFVQPIDYGYILKEFERLVLDHPIVSLDLHREGLAKFTFLWPKYQTKILVPIEELETVFDIEAVIVTNVLSINNDYIDKKLQDLVHNLA